MTESPNLGHFRFRHRARPGSQTEIKKGLSPFPLRCWTRATFQSLQPILARPRKDRAQIGIAPDRLDQIGSLEGLAVEQLAGEGGALMTADDTRFSGPEVQ